MRKYAAKLGKLLAGEVNCTYVELLHRKRHRRNQMFTTAACIGALMQPLVSQDILSLPMWLILTMTTFGSLLGLAKLISSAELAEWRQNVDQNQKSETTGVWHETPIDKRDLELQEVMRTAGSRLKRQYNRMISSFSIALVLVITSGMGSAINQIGWPLIITISSLVFGATSVASANRKGNRIVNEAINCVADSGPSVLSGMCDFVEHIDVAHYEKISRALVISLSLYEKADADRVTDRQFRVLLQLITDQVVDKNREYVGSVMRMLQMSPRSGLIGALINKMEYLISKGQIDQSNEVEQTIIMTERQISGIDPKDHLLRAFVESDEKQLLRPSTGAGEANPEELLRPTEQNHTESENKDVIRTQL